MPKILVRPDVVGNGVLWIVGIAVQVGGWFNQTIAIILLVLAFLWSITTIILWLRKKCINKSIGNGNLTSEDSKTKLTEAKPDLILGAKVSSISTYGYYDKAFGGGAVGDKKVFLDLILTPLKPVVIHLIALELWGNQYRAREITILPTGEPSSLYPIVIQKTISHTLQVDVPKEFAVNSKDARIFALANGLERYSEPFGIDFEDSK